MGDIASQLTAEERAVLLHVARSRFTPQGTAARARLVADCADLGVAEAARRASVSRVTAAKWWQRYRTSGIDSLDDAPRTGRPAVPRGIVHQILNHALIQPPANASRWTTRTVAESAGVSQATVSRIRRRNFRRDPGVSFLPDGSSIVTYLDVHPSGCALGFQASRGAAPAPGSTTTPSARLDVIETLVCAPLLCRSFTGHDQATLSGTGEGTDAVAVLRRAAERLPAASPVTLVVDVELDDAARQWLLRHPKIDAHSVTGEDWLALVHHIADAVDPGQFAELFEVQRLIRLAHSEGAGEFTWSRNPDVSVPAADPAPQPQTEPSAEDLMSVVRSLCTAIGHGELQAGKPISARNIARRSGVSPGRVTTVLAQLTAEALIDKPAGRYRLPVPAPVDVVETYTARALLGTAIVRKLASMPGPLPPAVDKHYAGLVRCDRLGLASEACMIDLDLQDELAQAAAMPRMSSMFVHLSVQLRIFVAIFGLDFRYPTDEIVADDHRILHELRRRDPVAAVAAWRIKIDNCARFMVNHLSSME
ncbi:helix-turn-helix domain-containing protein [Streptomyces olindensis]|uniref:helix-turn-helix domain-containing protein n=1 Tax=Streptomyces olindensis TaxID=358823 RepID=UPI00365C721A